MRDDREQSVVAVVGPQDSGRTSLVKSVLQHVSWRFDRTIAIEVDPRTEPLSAEGLASAILHRVRDAKTDEHLVRPVASLRALLQPTRGRGLALFVQGVRSVAT